MPFRSLQSWKNEVWHRLPRSVIHGIAPRNFLRKWIEPWTRAFRTLVVGVAIFGGFLGEIASDGGLSDSQRDLFICVLIIWLLIRGWMLASCWLREAKFTHDARARIYLPSERISGWWGAYWGMRQEMGVFAVECLVVGWWLAVGFGSDTIGPILWLPLFLLMATVGWGGWFLLLAAFRRRFDLPFESYQGQMLIHSATAGAAILLSVLSEWFEEICEIAQLALEYFVCLPGLGPAVGLLANEEFIESGHPPPISCLLILGPSLLPWCFAPWLSRRFRRFADRYWVALLAPHWPGKNAAMRDANPPVVESVSKGLSESFAIAKENRVARPVSSISWPQPKATLPRWAMIDRFVHLLFNEREKKIYDAVNPPGDPILTRKWILGAACFLVATLVGSLSGPAGTTGFVYGLFAQLGLVTAAISQMFGGIRLRFWSQIMGGSTASFPFFAGLPITLRDLVVTDWKTLAARTAVAYPLFFAWLDVQPMTNPNSRSFLILGTLSALLMLISLWPMRLPNDLVGRTIPPSIFSAAYWWRWIASLGVVICALLTPIGVVGFLAVRGWYWLMPFAGIALVIPIYFYLLIHWTLHNRVESSLELKPH